MSNCMDMSECDIALEQYIPDSLLMLVIYHCEVLLLVIG